MLRLLIVEDDSDLGAGIDMGLTKKGYTVDLATDGYMALDMLEAAEYDLAILDLNLPFINGLEILEEIRNNDLELRILILSARSFVEDKIKGLDKGANDYLTKPFDFSELEARIRNLLRQKILLEKSELTIGSITMDTNKRLVIVNGQIVKLTRKEYGLLEYLMKYPDRVFSAEKLIEHIWDRNADLFSNTFKYHIYSLRKKIAQADDHAAKMIQTIHGIGYKLSEKKEELADT